MTEFWYDFFFLLAWCCWVYLRFDIANIYIIGWMLIVFLSKREDTLLCIPFKMRVIICQFVRTMDTGHRRDMHDLNIHLKFHFILSRSVSLKHFYMFNTCFVCARNEEEKKRRSWRMQVRSRHWIYAYCLQSLHTCQQLLIDLLFLRRRRRRRRICELSCNQWTV